MTAGDGLARHVGAHDVVLRRSAVGLVDGHGRVVLLRALHENVVRVAARLVDQRRRATVDVVPVGVRARMDHVAVVALERAPVGQDRAGARNEDEQQSQAKAEQRQRETHMLTER